MYKAQSVYEAQSIHEARPIEDHLAAHIRKRLQRASQTSGTGEGVGFRVSGVGLGVEG
jgi:hypothetical protein